MEPTGKGAICGPVALGARKSSPINALQVEAGVPPLSFRLFRGLTMKKMAKWIGKTNNLITTTLEDLNERFRLPRLPLLLRAFRELPFSRQDVETSPVAERYRRPYNKQTVIPQMDLTFPPVEFEPEESPDLPAQ